MTPAQEKRERTLSIVVRNKPDVLARIAATFSSRGFNIESISANVTQNPAVTRIVLTTLSTARTMTRMVKQLHSLVDVLEVEDLSNGDALRREMALFRIQTDQARWAELLALVHAHPWRLLEAENGRGILEVTGTSRDIGEALELLSSFGPEDMARTGAVALRRAPGTDFARA